MREVLVITEPEKARVLVEPMRIKIMEILREGPKTVSDLATLLGKDRSTIYHHLKLLEKNGFIEEAGTLGQEKLYQRTARLILIKVEPMGDLEEFRESYFRGEAEKIVSLLELAGKRVRDRKKAVKGIASALESVEMFSREILGKLGNTELREVELMNLLIAITVIHCPELCKIGKEIRDFIE